MSDLKALIELNNVMDTMEEQMLATLELIKETRFKNNLLIKHFSSDTNVVCCDFHHHRLLKNN
jgi:hypothetical protein